MTVLEATGILFKWFNDKNSLNIERDFESLITKNVNEDSKAAFLCALSELVDLGIVKKTQIETKEGKSSTVKIFWVLSKPLYTYNQTVTISHELAYSMASFLNPIYEKLGADSKKINPLKIVESDFTNALILLNTSIEELDKRNQKN